VDETPDDVNAVQQLLDRTYERAGEHLRSIFQPELRIHARELTELLEGMTLLSLATVTATGEPRVAPVDGIFYRGRFWFGSSPSSLRFAHIRVRPAVSANHTRGEELAVIVHGHASMVDGRDPSYAGFADVCRRIYGSQWDDWGDDAAYARIEATHLYASRLPGGAAS
jgi:hypothetical protein